MLLQTFDVAGTRVNTYLTKRNYTAETEYANILQSLLDLAHTGEARMTRSGPVFAKFDTSVSCDMSEGFPLLHGRKLPFKSIKAELCGFLKGCTSAAQFRILGTGIWDANANVTEGWLRNPARKGVDDLGRIYGAQWTDWPKADDPRAAINQINQLIKGLIQDPFERAHIVSAWNVGELHLMSLKPCHVMFQCFVSDNHELSLKMYQRSADWFLGVPFNMPFNMASYGLLLLWLCQMTGYAPGKLKIEFGDYHLYDNHIEAAQTYLKQLETYEEKISEPLVMSVVGNKVPQEVIPDFIDAPDPQHFQLAGYRPMGAVSAPMAP